MPKTGNITGEPFDSEVIKQVNARQIFLGARNRTDSQIIYANNKTAFLRLASSIRVEDNLTNPDDPIYAIDILKQRGISSTLTGDELAKACVLFGGVTSIDTTNKSFEYNVGLNPNANNNVLSQLTGAYGWGGITSRGYVPMPGIDSADISFINRGAIAKANVNLKVFSLEQLQIFDLLYFRIGYTMLLEWGHNLFINNDVSADTGKPDPKLVERKDFFTSPFDAFFSTQKNTQNDIIGAIKEQRKKDNYNYDAMLGKVTNFTWKFNSDGSYDITLNLVGLGDIVEALKINTANTKDPKDLPPSVVAQREAEALARAEEALNRERERVSKAKETAQTQLNTADSDKQTQINNAQISFNSAKSSIISFNAGNAQANAFFNNNGLTDAKGLDFVDNPAGAKSNVTVINSVISKIRALQVTDEFAGAKEELIGYLNNLKTAQNKVANLSNDTKQQAEAQKAIDQADADEAAIEAKERALEAAQKAYNKKQAEAALSGNTTEENRNKTYFNNQLYAWKQAAITRSGSAWDPNNLYQLNFKARSENSVETGGKNLNVNFYYVRLGHVLDWVKDNLLVYDDKPKKTPMFDIDTAVDSNYCLNFPSQISTDPQICIISSKYISPTTSSIAWNVLPDLPAKYTVDDNPNAGKLMNIYVNIDFISKVLESGVDANGKTNLLKFLNEMLNGINDALGNVNKLEAIYDDEAIAIKIIEENNIKGIESKDPGKDITKIAVFKSYGIGSPTDPLGSFLSNIDFQVQLPPNMAAMATISAQAGGNVVGENATALSKLNKGLVDRIVTKKLDAASIDGAQVGKEAPENKFTKNLEYFSKQINSLYTQRNYSTDTIESIKSINRDIALYLTGQEALTSTPQNKKPSPFFIPFNLSLEMDGLSGMVNYERFSITEEILPYSYRSGDQGGVIDFLIKGISHSVSGNQWKTKIESISVSSAKNNA